MRLVDEVNWLNSIIIQAGQRAAGAAVNRPACAVKLAAAACSNAVRIYSA